MGCGSAYRFRDDVFVLGSGFEGFKMKRKGWVVVACVLCVAVAMLGWHLKVRGGGDLSALHVLAHELVVAQDAIQNRDKGSAADYAHFRAKWNTYHAEVDRLVGLGAYSHAELSQEVFMRAYRAYHGK